MEILNIKRNEKVTNIEEAKKVNTRHQNSLKKTKVNRTNKNYYLTQLVCS